MQLADLEIEVRCSAVIPLVTPFDKRQLQPATYDLLLGDDLLVYYPHEAWSVYGVPIDPLVALEENIDYTRVKMSERFQQQYELKPKQFILGTTLETVNIPSSLAARIEGKSSLGRLGLIVHSTAGFIDPGFRGQVTLEMANINSRSIILRPGMRIAQISFTRLSRNPERVYGDKELNSHYQDQISVQPARV